MSQEQEEKSETLLHLLKQQVSSGNHAVDDLLTRRDFYLLPPHPHYTQDCYRLCRGMYVKAHLSLEDMTVEAMTALLDEIGERK